MQNCKSNACSFFSILPLIAFIGFFSVTSVAMAQKTDRPWMNPTLSPEERADLVLKQLTLDEKIALLHGNGMAHTSNWQMPLTISPTAAPDTWRASSASEFRASSCPTPPTESETAARTADIRLRCRRASEPRRAGTLNPPANTAR